MNIKNLPLKFSLLAIAVAICIWSLSAYGLKQGIDLKGGYSLIFEMRTYQQELQELQQQREEVRQQLTDARQAGEDDRVAELEARLARIDEELERYEGVAGGENLAGEMISILKERVDPLGTRNLEWRPLTNSRIEVRMPAAGEATRQAKQRYLDAVEEIRANNLQASAVREILTAPGPQRRERIATLAGDDEDRAKRLEALAAAYDAEQQAREAYEQAVRAGADQERLDELQDAWLDAKARFSEAREVVSAANINLQRLEVVLANYVPQSEAQALRAQNPEALATRNEKFQEGLAELKEAHPERVEEIEAAVAAYREWAETRQRLEDPADLKRLIAKAGVLEFRIAPLSPRGRTEGTSLITRREYEQALESLREDGPAGLARRNAPWQWFPIRGERDDFSGLIVASFGGQDYVLLSNQPGRTMLNQPGRRGWQLDRAFPDQDQYGRLAIGFELDEQGARLMQALTSRNVGRRMAIVLDDEVYSAPVIREAIASRGIISGRFTSNEVDELVRTLRAGSLPARLNPEPVAERSFGPALGRVNREMGIRAAVIGLVAVATFMLIYYLLAGAIADVALLLNIILVLGVMSLPPIGAVFTLPGIAGLILTIGIAVDANVLIFERLREEQEKGQSVGLTIKNAYERAFSAIFDANLTTLITCLILAWVGTEEIRGFGIVLALGVVFSMFTALVVTRWIFQVLLNGRLIKRHVFMLRLMAPPKINWMAKRYYFWSLSTVMLVLGIGSMLWQGGRIWGIEFSSGTQAMVTLRDDALIDGELPNDALVRQRFQQQAEALRQEDPTYRRVAANPRVEVVQMPDRVEDFLADHDVAPTDGRITRQEWEGQRLNEAFFAAVDADGDGVLTRAELDERLPSTTYQVSTTETDLQKIRHVAREAFGDALQRREGIEYDILADTTVPELGIELSATGETRIRSVQDPRFSEAFREMTGGVLFVIDTDEPTPLAEVQQRIREMRYQPDFGGQMNETQVLGLRPVGEEGHTRLAVLVYPAEGSILQDTRAWNEFAENERQLLEAALQREEHMLATSFDAAIAGQAAQLAIIAIVLSCLAIIGYLWFRFGSVRWGLAAVTCLVHDVIIVVGLVAVSGWLFDTWLGRALMIESFKIDLAMIAAILTVVGYSVNDTIVVFDRIRENRGKLTTVSAGVINASINQTLPRTLLTSFTTLVVVIVMYVWGGPGIHSFSFALLMGILFGTYSSVAVASPLLLGFREAVVARTATAAVE